MTRATLTLLLADLEGSVRLWEKSRAQAPETLLAYERLIDESVAEHSGVRPIQQGEGDSFVAAFALASDALTCAIDIQLALLDLSGPSIRPRMALHTGEVTTSVDGSLTGSTIHRCARLRDAAHGGQIVVSRSTYDLLADDPPRGAGFIDLKEHRLRDLDRPEHVFQVSHHGLRAIFPRLRTDDSPAHNLPTRMTTFIGRTSEVEAIAENLRTNPLVTLTGPGGCGKTRLAIEVARTELERFPDGVFMADLAAIAEPDQVVGSVAAAVGLRDEAGVEMSAARISRSIADQKMLLVLDNCEHVISACAELTTVLIGSCARLRILATSREHLIVEGEAARPVPPLSVPPEGDVGLDGFESVSLFVDRAKRVRANFMLTAEVAPYVAQICSRLDGLPLAIELAAARVRVLSPKQIADALDDRFRLLSGGSRSALRRQQTMRASMDWSYDLLEDAERALFRRSSVFVKSFTLQAAEVVCAGELVGSFEVLDALTRLIERSLVEVEGDEELVRYRLLESVHEYASEKLASSGEAEAVRNKHLEYFLALAEGLEPTLVMSSSGWVQLETERANLRVALSWADELDDPELMQRCACALAFFWVFAGPHKEAKHWLERARERDTGRRDLVRARVLAGVAINATNLYDFQDLEAAAQEAFAIFEEAGDVQGRARILAVLGNARAVYDVEGGRKLLREAADLGKTCGDPFAQQVAMTCLGTTYGIAGDLREALRLHEAAYEICRDMKPWASAAGSILAYVLMMMGDLREARTLLEELVTANQLGYAAALDAAGLCEVSLLLGDYPQALESGRASVRVLATFENPTFEGLGRYVLGRALAELEGPDAARPELARAVELFDVGVNYLAVPPLAALAACELACGDIPSARKRADEAVEMATSGGWPWYLHRAATVSARVCEAEEDLDRAESIALEALSAQAEMGDKVGLVDSLELLADLVVASDAEQSVRLLGTAKALRTSIGYVPLPSRCEPHLRTESLTREAMGESFDRAWGEGASMTPQEAVVYATKRHGARKRPATGWASLTPVERQVVDLVVEGLTNPQIGERLFISKRTVQAHLARIFPKLAVASRSQLAALAARAEQH